jgi:hypothetical protein
MARKKNNEPFKDPWEDEEDLVPPKLSQQVPAVLDEIVEANIEISEEDGDENWIVKYSGDKPPTSFDIEARKKRVIFLQNLMNTGNVVLSAARSGVGWRALYLARDRHPDFARNWDMAVNIYHAFVANEKIRKWAIDGLRKPVWYQGQIVGYEIHRDSGMTQFYMKSAMPAIYGDKREIKIEGGLQFGIAVIPGMISDVSTWEARAKQAPEIGRG